MWIEVSFPDFSVDHIKVRAGTAVEFGKELSWVATCSSLLLLTETPPHHSHQSRSTVCFFSGMLCIWFLLSLFLEL